MNLIEFFQTYYPVLGAIAGVATIIGVVFAIYKATHEKHVRQLERTLEDLQHKLEASSPNLVEALQAELEATKIRSAEEADALRQKVSQLSEELEARQELLAKAEGRHAALLNRISRAQKVEGRNWEHKVLRGVPRFRPLSDRGVAILSVVNLKGGVGKTTITAHLGAAFARRGYRVLLVDLDLQGSLSSLFIPLDELRRYSDDRRLLQHYLTDVATSRKANLLEYTHPVLDDRGAIVATSDRLTYAEQNLTMQWLLRLGDRDPRFLLRRGLHQRRVTGQFDLVLLDCPPLLNTCCINALAASDYVLIPVTPSQKAAERVPQLLYEMRRFCSVVNPDLQVMGLLANRTRSTQMNSIEQDLWSNLQDRCHDQWEQPVYAFWAVIPQSAEVRRGENEFRPPGEGGDLHRQLKQLVAEIEKRLPGDCRRPTAASV